MKLFFVENLIFLITAVHSFPFSRPTRHDYPPFEPYPLDAAANSGASASSQVEGFGGSRKFGIQYPDEMNTHFHGNHFHRGENEGIPGVFTDIVSGENKDFPSLENGQSGVHRGAAAASATAIAGSNVGLDSKNSMSQAKSEASSKTASSSSHATSITSTH